MTSLCLESCSFKVSSSSTGVCVRGRCDLKVNKKGYPFTKGCRNHTRLWVCDVKNEAKAIPGLFILRLKCMCQACELETQTVITVAVWSRSWEMPCYLMGRMGRAWVEWRMCTYPVCVSFTHVRFWKPRGRSVSQQLQTLRVARGYLIKLDGEHANQPPSQFTEPVLLSYIDWDNDTL